MTQILRTCSHVNSLYEVFGQAEFCFLSHFFPPGFSLTFCFSLYLSQNTLVHISPGSSVRFSAAGYMYFNIVEDHIYHSL